MISYESTGKRFEERAFSGSFAAGIGFSITILQAFIQVPILLKFWGSETYGVWVLLAGAVTLISCLDLGLQTYVSNELCRAAARSRRRVRWILGSGVKMAAALGAVELVVTVLIVLAGLSERLFNVPTGNQKFGIEFGLLSYAIYWLLMGSVAGVLGCVYGACGMFARMIGWGILVRLLQFCALISAAALHLTPGKVIFAQCGVGFVLHILVLLDLKRAFPDLFPWWDGRLIQGFCYFKRSIALTFNNLMEQLTTNACLFFISGILGPAAIPAFAALRTVANSITQATGILLSPLNPELVRFHVRNEREKVRQTVATAWFTCGFLNFGLLGLALIIEPVFRVWTRGHLTFSFGLFGLLAFGPLVRSFGSPLMLCISGLNRLREQTVIATSRFAVSVGLGLVFLKWWGVSGMALAIVLGEMVSSLALPLRLVTAPQEQAFRSWTGVNAALGHLLTTGFVLGLAGVFPSKRILIICTGLVLVTMQSVWQWSALSDEVRHRVRAVLRQRLVRFVPMTGRLLAL